MCFTCPEDYFVGKLFVLARKHFFVSLLNLERNIYKIYPEFFRKSYQYCILGVWKNISTKIFPLELIKITFSISNFERTSFGRFATTVVDRWKFSVTFFSGWRKNSFSFLDIEQKNVLLFEIFPGILSNLQSTCPHELFNELCFMDFFSFFGHWAKLFNHVLPFSTVLLKLHSVAQREHLRRK